MDEFENDFITIYNKHLVPNYQGLVPLDIKLAIKLTYKFVKEKENIKLTKTLALLRELDADLDEVGRLPISKSRDSFFHKRIKEILREGE